MEPGLSTAPHTQQSHTATAATDPKGAQIATIVRAQLMPIIFERPTVQTRGEVMSYVRGAQTPYKVDLAMNFKVWLELSCSPLERNKGRIVDAVSQTGRRCGESRIGLHIPLC